MNNFLKIPFRHLWQSRLYSVINIAGLAIGITGMLLALLYWKDEHGFDRFHKANPNLYRITTTLIENKGDHVQTIGGTGQVQGPAFKEAVPEVKSYVRVLGGDIYSDVMANNKTIHLRPLFVDENFLDVFSFSLLRGDPKTVLRDINSVVLTKSIAIKLFNTTDVVGKQLQIDADPSFKKLGKPLIISGVVKNPPDNSSLRFEALFTFQFMRLSFEDNNWLNAYLGTFVVLNPLSDIHAVVQKFDTIYASHAKEQLAENFKWYGYDPQVSYGLQPMTDIHLNPMTYTGRGAEGGIINGSRPVYSYMFLAIALFILLMSCINFINISIANSLKRAKEVGIRKIAGGSRWRILVQFLNESAILCFISFLLSLFLLSILLPFFNSLTTKQIILADAFDAKLLSNFILLFAVIILATGFYPALILSNFKPSEVLYNKQKLSGRNLFGRGLVVIQFSLAIFFLIATLTYYRQMHYIQTKDLGYNPHQVIHTEISGDRDYKPILEYIKNELEKETSIKAVSFGGSGNVYRINVNNHQVPAVHKIIDENYLATLEIKLRAGRNLLSLFPGDRTNSVIVNEAFVKAAGLENPIGTQIQTNESFDTKTKTIIGVAQDFHSGSLREPIQPVVMFENDWPGSIWIKFENAKQKRALEALEKVYKAAIPTAVFQYNFLDELNAKQYVQEKRWQQVITIATFLCFVICCLGLFGLAHLSTHHRIKEIGIRKVLGAPVARIVALLSGDFLKLIMVAFLVAAPASGVVMNKWLQNYAYRIEISWWTFLFAVLLVMLIAIMIISSQSIKAAIANPVKSIRTD